MLRDGRAARQMALDDSGPWPRPTVQREAPVPIDVDRTAGAAIVVTLIPTVDQPTIVVDLFHADGPAWRSRGSSMSALGKDLAASGQPLIIVTTGWTDTGQAADAIHHCVVQCRGDVREVAVVRGQDVRRFDAPRDGCAFGVVWVGETVPDIHALGAAAERLGSLEIPQPPTRKRRRPLLSWWQRNRPARRDGGAWRRR